MCAVVVRDSKVTGSGSGEPREIDRAELIGEIADAILAVAPKWDQVKGFVLLLGQQLDADRIFSDVIWDLSVRDYLFHIVDKGIKCRGDAVLAQAASEVLGTMFEAHPELPLIKKLSARLEERALAEIRLLTEAERAKLRIALQPVAGISWGELAVIVNGVPKGAPVEAETAGSLEALLDVLEVATSPRGTVHVLIGFLAELAIRRPIVRDAVWAWIDECSPRLLIGPEQLAPLRGQVPGASQPQPRRVRAVLTVIDEKPLNDVRYRLSRWLRWDDGRITNKHDEDSLRDKKDLRGGGEDLLAQFHEVLRCKDAEVAEVEFFLPMSAINLDVDVWRVGRGNYKPVVGRRFRVVIHSSDRINDGMFNDEWQRRWTAFGEPHVGDRARWLRWADAIPPSGDLVPQLRDYDVLTQTLADCPALCCLGLHEGDSELDMQLTVAFQVGIPVVLWRRDGGDVARLRTLLGDLAATGRLAELPAEITALRQEAAGKPTDHPGGHLSLIWDDYYEQETLTAGLLAPIEAQGTDDARR
jgi:hypothetical protein